MKRCYYCFRTIKEEYQLCPYCGHKVITGPAEVIELVPGMVLLGRYIIGASVGAGGFGIIYRAWDTKLEVLVAIKEFYPTRIVTRAGGTRNVIVSEKGEEEFFYRKNRFLAEARTMAKLGGHRNIPNVFEFFEANNTAYIVMEFLEGKSLTDYLKQNGGILDISFALFIINEIGGALTALHQYGIVHRDVAPDNIFITSDKETRVKLLDLGAAKLADRTDDVIDIVLKPGYSPPEQYDSVSRIGPWTDIYALGATLYRMITGVKPVESTNRKVRDDLKEPAELNPRISETLNNTVLKAMALEPNMRFKKVSDFLLAAAGNRKVVPVYKEKRRRRLSRALGITAACAGVALLTVSVFGFYNQKKTEQYLSPASLTVWYCSESDAEDTAMKAVAEDFAAVFDSIHIELTPYSAEEYEDALLAAAKNDALPSLFESTGAGPYTLSRAEDITAVLESDQASECYFLDQYDNYYTERKCIPLGIEVPVAYIITSGPVQTEYLLNYFVSPDDFHDAVFSADDRHLDLIRQNFSVEGVSNQSDFFDSEENTSSVLISSSMIVNEVREKLTGYEKTCACYAADPVYCRFVYEWSIGAKDKDEKAAAEKILSWMLGKSYQNTLMIGLCSDGQIPVNKACFAEKTNSELFSGIKQNYNKFVFASDKTAEEE